MSLAEERRLFAAKSDAATPALRQRIAPDTDTARNRGGYLENPERGVPQGRPTMFVANFLIALLTEPNSSHFADEALADDCNRMLDFVLRHQFRDGSIDLGLWLHAPCEAGFCVGAAVAGCHDLRAQEKDFRGREELADKLSTFAAKAIPITREGPMYTTNHRWSAAVGPLAWANHFSADPKNIEAIDRYLATGLDIDEEGLYFYELSMGGYNNVSNGGLLSAGVLLERPELVDAVRRNLLSSIAFINPGGDIDTSFSCRQERGSPGRSGIDFLCARLTSLVTGDGVLASLADDLLEQVKDAPTYGPNSFSNLYWYRHCQHLWGEDEVVREPVCMDGRRHFHTACVYRMRQGDFAASVKVNPPIREQYNDQTDGWCGRKGAANLLSVWHGNAAAEALMFKAMYQNYQAMKPRELEVTGNTCRLTYHFAGFPLLEAPFLDSQEERGFQWADLRMEAVVKVGERQVDIELTASAPEGIETPVQVEFLLRTDGSLRVGDEERQMSARGVVWFDELEAEYWRQGAGLKITGGHVEHHWFLDDFKIESGWAEANCARLVVAGYTPFQRSFTISALG